MTASEWPILVNFLRFTTDQQIAEIIDNSNHLQHMRREVSGGLFETLVTICMAYYQRVIDEVKGIVAPRTLRRWPWCETTKSGWDRQSSL